MALAYSQAAMSLAAGIFQSSQNIQEVTRRQVLVARVPYGPFVTLIGLNLLSVGMGIILSVHALRRRKDGASSALLSTWGVVAAAFEPASDGKNIKNIDDLFQEMREGNNGRVVGLEREAGRGSWRYKVWNE